MNKQQERDYKTYARLVKNWRNNHKRDKKKLTDTEKEIRRRYKTYKYGAKSRGYEFKLSIKQFSEYWQEPCSYCGDEIETIGLDRVDNKRGYTIDNIVPCCFTCNKMKSSMDRDKFISHCEKISYE